MLAVPIPAYGAYATLIAASFILSIFGCGIVRDTARRLRLVDVPNERSLHKAPVPRLGGVAIVATVWLVLAIGTRFVPILDHRDVLYWLGAASVIALLGLVDDVRPLPAAARLVVQTAVAGGFLAFLLHDADVDLAGGLKVPLARATTLGLAVFFVVGTTNIYNFMDGMDGLAATQSITAGLALAVVATAAGQIDVAIIAAILAATSAGFFLHNAPPASLFLGDVGSTFIGFSFAALACVAATRPSPVALSVVPIALAPFLLDGAFTILRRLRLGERIWRAHRSHLYQRAVATGLTHRDVLLVYSAWCAAAAAEAVWIARSGVPATCATALAMVMLLVLVSRWVVRREARVRRASH
jgi:UDP-N-acetylmuramyl pentapeptide phosphotransferase/UDP-N-acetylglucosamine-1-phosphate transferase